MDSRFRKPFLVGVVLIACVALLVRWATHRDAADEPAAQPSASAISSAPPRVVAESGERFVHPDADSESAADSSSTLRGRVIDAATRQPVGEFEVRFHHVPGMGRRDLPAARAFRAKDGRFEWRDLPPGIWMVTTSAKGYQRFDLTRLTLAKGQPTAEIVMPLRRGHTLRGRVYDESSGLGIANAYISFREAHVGRFEGNFRARLQTRSGEDGAFVLDGVPPARVILDVSAESYARRTLIVVVDETTSVDVALAQGSALSGRITSVDGVTPLAGQVDLHNLDEFHGGSRQTSKLGEFSFEHLPAGKYRLTANARGATATRDIVLTNNQRIDNIVLAVGAGRSIRGVVTGLDVDELKRVTIFVWREDGTGADLGQTGPDAAGGYAVVGVQPGRVEVVADLTMRRQIRRTVELAPDADATVDLHFPPGVRLTGRVTRGGKPAGGVYVGPEQTTRDIFFYGARASADGRYEIDGLPPGEYRIVAGPFRSRPMQIADDTVFDIEIPIGVMTGFVFEERGEIPVVDANIQVSSLQSGSKRRSFRARSDHLGRFEVYGLEPGQFLLTVLRPGFEMFRDQVAYASGDAPITIRLRQDEGVKVRAVDSATNKPLRFVGVSEMNRDSGGLNLGVRLDAQGVGSIPSALAGSSLGFSAQGYAPITIGNWSGAEIELRFERQASR